jgi:hypothetical protein
VTPGAVLAQLDDSVIAWAILALTLAALGLAPSRWWAALSRREP